MLCHNVFQAQLFPSKLKVCCEHSKISHHQNPGHFHATKRRNAVKYKANSFMVSPCITNGWSQTLLQRCFPGHHWLPHAIPHAMPHMMPHAMPIPHPMAPTMPGEMETWSHLFQRWVCFHLGNPCLAHQIFIALGLKISMVNITLEVINDESLT